MAKTTNKTNSNSKLLSMSMEELLQYEKASRIICCRYENSIKGYDGSLRSDTKEYPLFSRFNAIHGYVLNEIEDRLNKIVEE